MRKPIVWVANPADLEEFSTHDAMAKAVVLCNKDSMAGDRVPLYLDSSKSWESITDADLEVLAEKHVTDCYFNTLTYAREV